MIAVRIALLTVLTWVCDLLTDNHKVLWRVGDLTCKLVPARVANRHQSEAYQAGLWLEAYEDRPATERTREEDLTAAHARLHLSLPWA